MKTNKKTQAAPKAYTTSELFTRMNQVRGKLKLSREEAFVEARRQLEEEHRQRMEEERIAKEKAMEEARLRAEQERLRIEAERKAKEEERKRLEAERLQAEQERLAKEQAIALKLKAESDNADRILAENRAKNDACRRLLESMKDSAVKFTFINERGMQATTTGTLDKERFPKTRMVAGTLAPKNENMFSFYDIRHGIYRQCEQDKIISIDIISVKRGRPAQKKETAVLETA